MGLDGLSLDVSPFGDTMGASEHPDLDPVFRALADPTRRALLDQLAAGPARTGTLVDAFPKLSRTGVMKHLDVLVAAGLVRVRRRGRERWNTLDPLPIQAVHDRWVAPHVRGLAQNALALKRHVEQAPHPEP